MKLTHIISLKMLKLKTHRWDLPFLVLQRWFENLEAVLGRAALTRPSSGAGGGAGQSLGFRSPAHFLLNDKRARVSSAATAPWDLGLLPVPAEVDTEGSRT